MPSPDRRTSRARAPRPAVGWREWVLLPDLAGGQTIKAKVDTGARTSAVHATAHEEVEVDGRPWIRFLLHPDHDDPDVTVEAMAPLVDRREVRSSSGEAEERYVVRTPIVLHGLRYQIELTLTERSDMGFRMLLGRRALRRRFVVDPGRSYLSSDPHPPDAADEDDD